MDCLRCISFVLFATLVVESTTAALVTSSNGLVFEKDPNGKPCQSVIECLNCNKARYCIPVNNILEQIAVISCDPDSSTPFCNPNGGCTNVPSAGCETDEFICPAVDGIYPDPTNCSIFHICAQGRRTTNECPIRNVYDHEIGECKRRRRLSDCATIKCNRKNEGQDVLYPKDSRIWAVCSNGRPYITGRCKDYETYDTKTRKCVRICREVGNQPHETECQKYVRCSEIGPRRYQTTVHSCACNEGYDERLKRCTTVAPCLLEITSNPDDLCKKDDEGPTTPKDESEETTAPGTTEQEEVTDANTEVPESTEDPVDPAGEDGNNNEPADPANDGNGDATGKEPGADDGGKDEPVTGNGNEEVGSGVEEPKDDNLPANGPKDDEPPANEPKENDDQSNKDAGSGGGNVESNVEENVDASNKNSVEVTVVENNPVINNSGDDNTANVE